MEPGHPPVHDPSWQITDMKNIELVVLNEAYHS
jgi:hypothetical protein